MINTLRGAALAVAAFAGAVSMGSAPALAMQNVAAVGETSWAAHGAAAVAPGLFALNDSASGRSTAADAFAAHMNALESAAPAVPRTLAELVALSSATETDGREEHCLASAIYFEARGESLEGQLAVAEVVLNRAQSGRYPASLCGVVVQPAQFSFVRRGVIPAANRASEAWRRAVAIARIAKAGATRLLSGDVLWYHANYVAPSWGRRLALSNRIGAHIFYR